MESLPLSDHLNLSLFDVKASSFISDEQSAPNISRR